VAKTQGYRNTNFSRGRGRRRGRRPLLQHSFSGPGPSQRPCQVCHKQVHTAATCWFGFEEGYQADPSPINANLASAPSATDSQWYHDTGSNVHLTNELSNPNLHAEDYAGNDQIRVGNEQGLHVSHFGRGLLPTPSRNFHFFSLFHVPQIQKNLIFVNQFTCDNNVFIEFHPNYLCVKDLRTRQLLLQGPSKFGLYPWPSSRASSSSSFAAIIGEKVSLDQWHLRLGHPAPPIVTQVIQSNKLLMSPSKFSSVCSSCEQGKSHRFHFSYSPSISSSPLQLLFLDVWGSASITFVNNKRFYFNIVDDFSKYTWLFPLGTKSEVCATFLHFKQLVETFFSTKPQPMQQLNYHGCNLYSVNLVLLLHVDQFSIVTTLAPHISHSILSIMLVQSI
jgi:hypothetical protein